MIAAGNASFHGAIGHDMGTALADRMLHICADAIVNSTLGHLNWLRLPPGSISLEGMLAHTLDLHQSSEKSLLEWDVERLYRAIDDRRPATPSTGGRQIEDGGTGKGGPQDPQTHEADRQGGTRDNGPRAARVRLLGADTPCDLLPDLAFQGPPEE